MQVILAHVTRHELHGLLQSLVRNGHTSSEVVRILDRAPCSIFRFEHLIVTTELPGPHRMDIPTTCIVTWVEEKALGRGLKASPAADIRVDRSMQNQGVMLLTLWMRRGTLEEHARGAGKGRIYNRLPVNGEHGALSVSAPR